MGAGDGLLPAARPGRTPDRSPRKYRKKYLVSGPRSVFGVKSGQVGELDLTEAQEADLMEAGHIKFPPVERAKPEPEKEER